MKGEEKYTRDEKYKRTRKKDRLKGGQGNKEMYRIKRGRERIEIMRKEKKEREREGDEAREGVKDRENVKKGKKMERRTDTIGIRG